MSYPIFTDFLNEDFQKINLFSLKKGDKILLNNNQFDSITSIYKEKDKEFIEIVYFDSTKSYLSKDSQYSNLFGVNSNNIENESNQLIEFSGEKDLYPLSISHIVDNELFDKEILVSLVPNLPFQERDFNKINSLIEKNNFRVKMENDSLIFFKEKTDSKQVLSFTLPSYEDKEEEDLSFLFIKNGCLVSEVDNNNIIVLLPEKFPVNKIQNLISYKKNSNNLLMKQIKNINSIGTFESYKILTENKMYYNFINGDYNII